MLRARSDVLAALHHFAQRVVSGVGGLGVPHGILRRTVRPLQRHLRSLVGSHRLAQLLLQSVPFSQQVAQSVFEARLLLTRFRGLALLHFDVGVHPAHSPIDGGVAVAEARDPVFEARDTRQQADVSRVLHIAFGLTRAQQFLRRLHFAFGGPDRGLLLFEALFELLEFGFRGAVLLLRRGELLAKRLEFFAPRFAGLFQIVPFAAGQLDSAFEILDFTAQPIELFRADADGLLGFR